MFASYDGWKEKESIGKGWTRERGSLEGFILSGGTTTLNYLFIFFINIILFFQIFLT